MPKTYAIKWVIDDTQAQAVLKRGQRAVEAVEASMGKVVRSTEAGAAKRIKAETDAAQKIDVGYYKTAMQGIRYQDQLTKAAAAAAREREKIEDRANMMIQRQMARQRSFELGPNGRLGQQARGAIDPAVIQQAAMNRAMDTVHKKQVDIRLAQMGLNSSFEQGIMNAVGLGGAMTGIGAAAAGIGAAVAIIDTVAAAFNRAKERALEYGRATLDTLRELRPLAGVMGEKPTEEFGERIARFGVQAAMSPEESRTFLEAFRGRAQMVRGKNISEAEFGKYELLAAQLTGAKGIAPGPGGEMFGQILKTKNFQAAGEGSEAAAAQARVALKILDAGVGEMAELVPQFNKLMVLAKESGLEGVFRSAGEAAVATSVAAEYDPGEAATTTMRYAEKLGELATEKKFGLSDKQSFLEQAAVMNKVIAAKLAGGTPIKTALTQLGVTEIRARRGAETFFGARESTLAPELAMLAAGTGPGAGDEARREIDKAQKEKTAQDAKSLSRIALTKFQEGRKASDLKIAMQNAESEIIQEEQAFPLAQWMAERVATVASGNIRAGVFGGLLGGDTGAGRNVLIEQRARRNAMAGAGQPVTGTDLALDANPITRGAQAGLGHVFGNNQDLIPILNKIAENTAALKGQGRAPDPLPGAPPARPIRP